LRRKKCSPPEHGSNNKPDHSKALSVKSNTSYYAAQ
jgi:hypothetical protein